LIDRGGRKNPIGEPDCMNWIMKDDGSYWSPVELHGCPGIVALVKTCSGAFECIAIFELSAETGIRTFDEARQRAQRWIEETHRGA
jgi:hypothetical protein